MNFLKTILFVLTVLIPCRGFPIMQAHCTSDDLSENMTCVPQLPNEIIDYIIGLIPPCQIVASKWFHLSRGFKFILDYHVKRCNSVNACENALREFFRITFEHDINEFSEHKRFLDLLLTKLLNHIERFSTPIGLLSHIVCCFELSGGKLCLSNLTELTISIGDENGYLTSSNKFDCLKAAGSLFGGKSLKAINLDVIISDNEHLTLCGFRSLVRFLQESSDDETVWNLTLRDQTILGQGWFGPTDLSKSRNKAFICYVRTLLDHGIVINTLSLLDNYKPSPYMLIMVSFKRRSIYMYPEYKNCKELKIYYDIGLVAPVFAHEDDRYKCLEIVEVHESHVLYKSDFLAYLSNAPGLCEIRVILPASWSRRVSSCRRGCFQNPDFACFREDGWCSFHEQLKNVKLTFV